MSTATQMALERSHSTRLAAFWRLAADESMQRRHLHGRQGAAHQPSRLGAHLPTLALPVRVRDVRNSTQRHATRFLGLSSRFVSQRGKVFKPKEKAP